MDRPTLIVATVDRDLRAALIDVNADILRVDTLDAAADAIAADWGAVLAIGPDLLSELAVMDESPFEHPTIVVCTDTDELDWLGAYTLGAHHVVEIPIALDWLHDHLTGHSEVPTP